MEANTQAQKQRRGSDFSLACIQSSRQLIEKQTCPNVASSVLLEQANAADRNCLVHSAVRRDSFAVG